MTSPIIVGQVGVEVTATARGFARRLREAVVREFKSAALDKTLADAIGGKRKIKIPVQPEYDNKPAPRTVPRTPGRSDDPDVLLRAFQQDVQRQVRALAKQTVNIPLRPDTERLRTEIGAALDQVQKTARARIPVEAGDRRDYEQSLRTMLDRVAARIKTELPAPTFKRPTRLPKVPVQVDPVMSAFQQQVRRDVARLGRQVQANIPVTPDTDGLRARLARQLAAIQRESRLQVPTEPAARAAYEARLRSMLAAVQRALPPVRTNVRVDVDRSSLRQATAGIGALAGVARGAAGAVAGLAGIGAVAGAGAAGLAGLASAAGGAVQLLAGLASAAATASGALFLLPGAAAVAAAGIGALALGFSGIGSAIKESAKAATGGGGGGAIIDTARQIAQAQRGVASAERTYQAALRESKRAQEDLNRARKAAVERIEDLSRALRGARLDEREAAIRLRDAREDLDRAQENGNTREIERAQLAYEQAALALENAKDAAADLADENADAAKRGVEGSDEVRSALDRQQQAADSLASATEGLASAQESLAAAQKKMSAGGGGGVDRFAEAMAKLAPAARDVVRTIIALRPAWEAMQRAVQQALFVGVAADLRQLSTSILPTLRTGLVGVADVLNGQLRAAMAELSTESSRFRLAEILDNARAALAGLTPAVRPLTKALMDVSAVGTDVLKGLSKEAGDFLAGVAEKLSRMASTGELKTVINNGLDALKQIGAAAADVGGIIRGIFSAANAGGEGAGLFGMLDRLNKLVNSVAGQSALTELFTQLGRIGDALMPVLLAIGQAMGPVAGAIAQVAEAFAPVLVELVGALGTSLASLAPAFISLAPLVGTLASGLQPLASILVGLVQAAAPGLNAFLGALVQGLQALVPVAPVVGQAIGDVAKALAPLLPMIAQGLAEGLAIVAPLLSALAREFGPVIAVISKAFVGALAEVLPVLLEVGKVVLPIAAKAGAALAKALLPLVPVLIQIAAQFAGKLAEYLPKFAEVLAEILPVGMQVASLLGKALLDALVQIGPYIPELAAAGLELALAMLQLLPTLLPLLPPLVQLAVLALRMALQSGVLQVALRLLTGSLNIAATAIRVVSSVLSAILNPIATARAAAGRLGDAFRDGAGRARDAVKGLGSTITSALGDAGQMLYDSGRKIVTGLIKGIRSMFGGLQGAGSAMAQIVKDHLPFSPAKTGPLSGRGNPYYSGQSIVSLLAAGVTSNLGIARRSADDLASSFLIAPTSAARLGSLDLPAAAAGVTVPVEIPIYIGDEVTRVVRTEISTNNRDTRRRAMAGAGVRR